MKKIAFIVRLFQDKSFYAGSEKLVYKIINEFVVNAYETAKKYTWNNTFLELERHFNELQYK